MTKPHQINRQTPNRQSRRLKNLEPENLKNEKEPPLTLKPQKIKRQKSIPLNPPQANPAPSPTTPVTAASFKEAYEDINNPKSFSGDIKSIANQIPSYRYVERIRKLAKRLSFES